ncbi:MAG: CoA-binding protein [Myxococcota bacterium]
MFQSFIDVKRIAVVGVSRGGKGFGNYAAKALRERGYEVFAINAQVDEVAGEKSWRSLAALPVKPDLVVTVVPPAETTKLVEECAQLGLTKVWMQQGSESPEAVALAKERHLEVVPGACVLMHLKPTGFHAFHGWLNRTFSRTTAAG